MRSHPQSGQILFLFWAPAIKNLPKTNAVPAYFADIIPTFAAIAGKSGGFKSVGMSIYPFLKSPKIVTQDRFLYWEFLNWVLNRPYVMANGKE